MELVRFDPYWLPTRTKLFTTICATMSKYITLSPYTQAVSLATPAWKNMFALLLFERT